MRLDLALYVVAIVLFALAATVFVIVPADQGQLVYSVSVAVLGFLMIATGYVVRPKAQAPAQVQPVEAPSSPAAEPIQQASPIEVPVAPAVNVEAPVVEAPPPQPSAETPQSPTEVPAPAEPAESVVATPVLTAPEPAPQLSAPAESPALASVVPVAAVSELTTIRGINAKRAEQLSAIGINTIEDLAKISPEDLAAKLGVDPRLAKMWVGTAKKQAK
jgi:predicted flap endonuclease-1-like 5' DNA nuclease